MTVAADSGSNDVVTIGTNTLTFAGTANEVETSASGQTITVGLPNDVTIANNLTVSGNLISDDITTATLTTSGNLTVTGNLTVNGTTTTNNSVNLTVDDNLIELNSGISASSNDAGIIIERGTTGNNAAIIWDESADKFTMGTTTATAADLDIGW